MSRASLAEQLKPEAGPRCGPAFEHAVDGTDVANDRGEPAIDDKTAAHAGAPEPGDPGRLAEIKAELAMTPGRNRMYDLGM